MVKKILIGLAVIVAGFAAFVATWIGLFIMIFYAAKERGRFDFLRWSNLSKSLSWDILKLSIPAGLATVVMMVGFGLFAQVAGKLDAIAALNLPEGSHAEAVNGAATTDIVAILKTAHISVHIILQLDDFIHLFYKHFLLFGFINFIKNQIIFHFEESFFAEF